MALLPEQCGEVVGVALNFRGEVEALREAMRTDPYKQPPRGPILYLKPPNTWLRAGEPIACPKGTARLKMAGTIGLVMGRAACRLAASSAMEFVAGYRVVNDVSIPHDSYYRPAIRERCSDGFHPMSDTLTPSGFDPDAATIRVFVNGELRSESSTTNLIRSAAQLIADISEFQTLAAGDVLLVGEPENSPLAMPGDVVRVEIEGLGAIENAVVAE
jgi:5-oxopent-3-ene-1,2,5-tricarboxylate decarboxylase/2-hydroxyhepta-2,4-diene-1,7-dioate isomerase